MIEIILKDFAEWIKTQPVYIGGKTGNKQVLVLRDGEMKSAVEVYLEDNKLPFTIEEEDCMDDDAKQASIPYTYNAPQHDWKCGYPDITRNGDYKR